MSFETQQLSPFGVKLVATAPNQDIHSLGVEFLRELFHREHLVLLRGFRTFQNSEAFADYCARFGEVSLWPFGKVLELIEQKNPADHIFDHNYVPLHWDGMYRPQVPEFQIFHCVNAPENDQGGRTTFSNTALALNRAPSKLRDACARVTGVYHRKMEYYHSKTVAPIITAHPTKGFPVIRYCEQALDGDENFINRSDFEFMGLEAGEAADFHASLRAALYSPENFYAHAWQKGDVVLSDNYTLLHGREAFASGAPRHLQRVHVLGQPALDNPHLVFHK